MDQATIPQRLAKFPNLTGSRLQDHDAETASSAECIWTLGKEQIPEGLLAASWAVLLQKYTKIGLPAFLLNGRPVYVPQPRSSQPQICEVDVPSDDLDSTELTLGGPGMTTRQRALRLSVELKVNTCRLTSSWLVPSSFLKELGAQFMDVLCEIGGQGTTSRRLEPSLSVLNPSPKFIDGPTTLHEMLSRSADKSKIAIEYHPLEGLCMSLSYANLHEQADRLSIRILQQYEDLSCSTASNPVMPLLIPQHPNLYVSQLAILKCGGAFCPINLDAPSDRIKFIVEDLQAKVLLTTTKLRPQLSDIEGMVELICVDSFQDNSKSSSLSAPTIPEPNSPAYVMYTSGSTGKPKGVPISHRAATQALLAHHIHMPQFKRFLQFASPTFDVSVFEIFFTLFRGATLICTDRERLLSDLPKAINDLRIDVVELTPTVAATLVQSRQNVPNLKVLLTIGEMLTERVVSEFGAGPDDDEGILWALYGPTEATIHCTIAPNMSKQSGVGNIGEPLSSVSALVVDYSDAPASQQPRILPIGQIGELAVGGHQLAHGYLNRPGQTAAAFIDLPSHGQVYRTGDKVRLLPNGRLECLGRISNTQVKLRGQRIELGEIEATAYRAPDVDLACAAVIDGALVIFCTSSNNAACHEVKLACEKWLPRFMRPNDILLLQKIPRLSSGKVDRKALGADYKLRSRSSECKYEDEVQHKLASIVDSELHSHLRTGDILAAHGLDSLRAITISSLLRSHGFQIKAAELLETSTIEALASLLVQQKRQVREPDQCAMSEVKQKLKEEALSQLRSSRLGIQEVDMCTPIQLAMLSETVGDSRLNCNWFEVQFPKTVDVGQLGEAVRMLAHHNDILRSGFIFVETMSSFARIIWDELPVSQFSYVDHFDYGHHARPEVSTLPPLSCQISKARHRALFHAHHAIFDGWSLDQMMLDLEQIMSGEIPRARPQYSLISDFYAQYTGSQDYFADQKYWKSKVQSMQISKFPMLCPRKPASPTVSSKHQDSCVQLSKIDDLTKRLRVSRQSIVAAAFTLLLGWYTRSANPLFGVISSGRTLPVAGITGILGPCLTNLPTSIDLSQMRTIHDLIIQCHRANREALAHELMPLPEIKRLSNCPSDEQLFDSLFVWQESNVSQRSANSGISVVDSRDHLNFALVLETEPKGDALCFKLTYKTSTLPDDQADLICKQLDVLLTRFVDDNTEGLESCLDAFSGRQNLLSLTNSNYHSLSDETFDMISNLEDLASRQPQRPALEFVNDIDPTTGALESQTVSYSDLNIQADRLASYLQSENCGPDDVIAVWMEKSVEMYSSILGIIKCGSGYLPLDPASPFKRAAHVMEESHIKHVLTVSSFEKAHELPPSMKVADADRILRDARNHTLKPVKVQGSNVAYAVFTSGTTGNPKGLLVTRKNVTSNLDVLAKLYPVCNDAKLLQSCSIAFDVAVFEIFFTWHQGMCLVSARNDILFRNIESFIQSTHVTHLSLTPSVASIIQRSRIPGVKFLVTAGEGLTPKVFRDWADGECLYQGYGPAETTNICTIHPRMDQEDFLTNLGLPLENTSAFVVEDSSQFRLLPKGCVGEFCFGGDQVCRGYINSPQLTAEKFTNHPDFGWLYRTGDMGRILADGSLQFLGRKDDQVKIRGQRVELAEIDQVMIRQLNVADSATLIINDEQTSSERIVTFYTSDYGTASNPDLLQMLSEYLPSYMLPDDLNHLDRLPMTVQGKIDKRVLKDSYKPRFDDLRQSDKVNAKTFTDFEYSIAVALAQVCNISLDDIKPDHRLISLGLDSIKSISFSRKLRNLGFNQVDVSTIHRHNTIAALANVISADIHRETPEPQREVFEVLNEETKSRIADDCAGRNFEVQKILPCTPLQEAILSESMAGKSTQYENKVMLTVRGNIERLQSAWEVMVRRHDILRTLFVPTGDVKFPFAQVVLQRFALPWFDLSSVSGSDSGTDDEDNDLPPPYKIQVQRSTGRKTASLEITMNHALYDAEAISILLQEVESVYHGRELAPAPAFEIYLARTLSAREDSTLESWTAMFEGYRPHSLIDDLTRQNAGASTYATVTCTSRTAWSVIQAASTHISVNVSSTFQASWTRLLSFFLSTRDLCFGNVYSGRDTAGTESIVAPCFNTLPLRAQIQPHMTNSMLARDLQRRNLEILPLQATSLRLIQKCCKIQSRRLFDTLLLVQQSPSFLDDSIWTLDREEGDMPFPLILEIIPHEKSDFLSLSAHGDVSKLPFKFLQGLLEMFDEILRNTITFQESQCNDFSFLLDDQNLLEEYKTFSRSNAVSYDLENKEGSGFFEETELRVVELKKAISTFLPNVMPQQIDDATTIFQLGLDSINAFQLSSLLKKKGFSITAADILDAASISRIANRLRSIESIEKQPELPIDFVRFHEKHLSLLPAGFDIPLNNVQIIRPCTKAQNGMLAQLINSRGKTYLNTIEYETSADVSTTFARWENAMKLHEMLRTGFVSTDDQDFPFAMVTYQAKSSNLPVIEDVDRPFEESTDQIKNTLHEQPWRICIKPGHVKVMMLHSMYDAQSLQTLLRTVDGNLSTTSLGPCAIQPLIGPLLKADLESEQSRAFWEASTGNIHPSRFPNLHTCTDQKGGFDRLVLSADLTMQDVLEGCKQNGITLQVAGQAAWAYLLSAYTGEIDVTFGVVMSTRPSQDDMRSIVFPCVNTLPVFINVGLEKRNLLESLSKHNAELLRHPNTPLSNIQRWVKIEQPLFDSVFVFQKMMNDDTSTAPSIRWKDDIAMTEYALSMEMIPNLDGNLDFSLTFDMSVLPHQQAAVMLKQFNSIFLDIISSSPALKSPLSSMETSLLSIVQAKERRISSPVQYLHGFVERKATQYPEKVALEFVDRIHEFQSSKRQWSFKQLNSEGNKFANLLRSHGCCPRELIGICFDKCPEASFAILGILKADCAFVALDPGAPLARKEYIIRDANCRFLVTTADKAGSFARLENVKILVANDQDTMSQFDDEPHGSEVNSSPSDVCYCLYTSGTTGNPKGCLISHENAVQAMLFFQRIFDGHWNEQSRWLQFASFHFDVSVMEQYLTWSLGMCLVSTPRDILLQNLAGNIAKLDITHIDLTPSLARLITPEEVPSLCRGVFITGGEALRREVLDAWGDHAVIYNGYGPSEVSIGCTMHPRVTKSVKPSNIGPQFDNVGSYVMMPGTHEPVIRGAIGELCLTGVLVGIGYLNRPDLTIERFPKLRDTGERMYRTGDLVRLLPDNTFEFIGRIDDQVKLRGQRLEIGEINEVIRQATSRVEDIATLVLKHPTQQKDQLVSFFTTADGRGKSTIEPSLDAAEIAIASEIKRSTEDKLPPYMIPSFILPISRIPLSSNNKTEARVLKTVFEGMTREDLRKFANSSSNASSGDRETVSQIVSCLAETLNLHAADDILPSSSFFEVGLDSISAISLARRLKTRGLTEVHPSMIMKYSTVAGLANALKAPSGSSREIEAGVKASKQRILAFAHKHITSAVRALGIKSGAVEAIAPVTALQAGMISKTMQSQYAVYHSTFEFDLSPSIDLRRLEQAWATARNNLQILRTRFLPTEDGYAQVVLRPEKEHNFWVEIDKRAGSSSSEIIEKWMWNHSTSLDRELWKIHLERNPESCVLHLSLFHGLYDGVSLDRLLDYVGRLYHDHHAENTSPKFFDVLAYGPLCEIPRAREFWQGQPLPPASLGLQASSTPKMICMRRALSPSPGLAQCRNGLKVTVTAIFHASWLLTLFDHFQVLPIHGVIVSGRAIDFEGVESVIGPMFNTIPCYITIEGLSRVSELIASCHEFNASIMPFQHTPLRDILKWQKRSPSHPLFDSLFVFQKESSVESVADKLWNVRTSNAAPDYPLAIEIEQRRDHSFGLTLVANTPTIDHYIANQLLDTLEIRIKQFIEDPELGLPEDIQSKTQDFPKINGSADTNGHVSETIEEKASEEIREVRQQVAKLAHIETDQIYPASSIFELGLDSIDAIKLSARLKEVGLVISMSQIMQSMTINGIAARCNQIQENPISSRQMYTIGAKTRSRLLQNQGMDKANVLKVIPATPLQEGLISGMVASNFQQYFSHDLVEVEEGIDINHLLASFGTVMEENDILRTRFIEMDDPESPSTYAQVVMKSRDHDWRECSLNSETDLDQLLLQRRNNIPSKGLNQDMFSVMQINIHLRKFLLISMSHALHDGISLAMLHHDVAAQYEGACPRRPQSESFIAESFSQSGDDALSFWADQLNGMHPSIFPANEDDLRTASSHRIEYPSGFPVSRVLKFCRSENITMQTLGLTCWLLVLAHRLQRLDVCSGLVVSGRTSKEAEEIMFPTMNTVAFRAVVHGTGSEMLHYVQDTSARISEFQHFPLRKVRAAANISQRPFDAIFLYQRRLADLSQHRALYRSRNVYANTEYPVNIEWEIVDDNLVFRTACSSAVFGTPDIEILLRDVDSVLSFLLKDSSTSILTFKENEISICDSMNFVPVQEQNTKSNKGFEGGDGLKGTDSPPFESSIKEVLSEVANVPLEALGTNTSLFEIGLDSISAIKVSSLLRRKSIRLTVSDMMKAVIIWKIAQAATYLSSETVDNSPQRSDMPAVPTKVFLAQRLGISDFEIETILPATAGQAYMLQVWKNAGEGLRVYPTFHYRVHGNVSRTGLETAWARLCEMTPILRTIFTSSDGVHFVQVVLRQTKNPVQWLSQRKSDSNENRDRPPVRLLAKRDGPHLLIGLQLHHALYDAVSLPLILSGLQKLCNKSEHIFNFETKFSPYISSSMGLSTAEGRQRFWTNYLKDTPHCSPIPSTGAVSSHRTEMYHPTLLSDASALVTRAKLEGVSIQCLFFALCAKLYLQHFSFTLPSTNDSDSLVIGIYMASRSHTLPTAPEMDLTTLTAPTFNILPLRITFSANHSLYTVARQIQEDITNITSLAHIGASLREISTWTDSKVKLNTFVNFLRLPDGSEALSSSAPAPTSITTDSDTASDVTFAPIPPWTTSAEMEALPPPSSPFPASSTIHAENRNDESPIYNPRALDIEAVLRNGGLDVGIFAPADMLDEETSSSLMDKIQDELMQLVGIGSDQRRMKREERGGRSGI